MKRLDMKQLEKMYEKEARLNVKRKQSREVRQTKRKVKEQNHVTH